jgi:hypothetical protein
MKRNVLLLVTLLSITMLLSACAESPQELAPLPPPEPDGGPFGVDTNINMSTIDDFLLRPDVAYFDMRMFNDPADYEAIGGISKLTQTLPGYRIVPFPYLARLGPLPVSGAYDGEVLFEVVWGENREILEITPVFIESELILHDLFPRDKAIFLMCGGAGYSAFTKVLLIHFGWDENLIYNTGGNWHYTGINSIELLIQPDGYNTPIIATWRANYAHIDFDQLHRIEN